jgi:penicillin-binding protein 1A
MTARQRRRHRRSQGGSVGKKVLLVFAGLFALIIAGLGGAALWVQDIRASAPSIDTLKPAESGENSEVFAADGTSLGYVQSSIIRDPVELPKIPRVLRNATIAIEDENFYEHSGVDYSAVIRAAVENLEAGEVEQGASTITQQLVRNLYIDDPEDTIERKIVEAEMAREYEEEHTKQEILEEYLNTASYGTNDGKTAVGVQAASQVYFNKDVSELNLGEAALLAGLPQAPTDYNPFLNPNGATNRRNQVLAAMVEQGYITQATADAAKTDGLGLERGYRYESRTQQYFFDFVQQELIDRYGVQTVRDGGLRVYTTLDPRLQTVAEQAIAAHPVSGAAEALVSTDVDTGEIIAMASSESYEDSQFNLAAQGRRQPGSSFKPYALTAAVDQGIDPDQTFYSAPSTISIPQGIGAAPWVVSGGAGGSISLRQATANSVNTVYAQLVTDIGPETMDEMAKRMGVSSPLSGYPADVLGASDVTVLDQSNGFATLANGGVHHDPTAIAKVEFPDGDVDEPEDPEGTRVVSDGVAYTVADVMKGTLEYGTAAGHGIGCPASGKTGTTEEQADAWFVGYTPHVSTAVWVGNPDQRVALPGYGADLAAPIWHDYMMVAATEPCDDFPEPQNPADLSGYYSEHTVDSDYDSDTDSTATTTPDTDADEADADDPPAGGYDPDLYAPGAGQDPAPTPDPPQEAPDVPDPGQVAPGGGGPPTGGAGGVDPN